MLVQYIAHFVITLVLVVICYILYTFWAHVYVVRNGDVMDKFKTILTIISTIASVIFGSAVVLQVLNFSNQRKIEEIESYSKLSKEFLDDIILLFLNKDNHDMVYFYNELFQVDKINSKTKRNLNKEHMISMLLFSKCAKFAIFDSETTNYAAKIKVQKWIGHIVNTFMKSDILKEYWTDEYKPKLSGPATQKYMKEHFNI